MNSATATITIGVGAAITTSPQNQTIASGATANLSVLATGTAPLTYQWFQGTAPDVSTPVGNDSASFTTPALTTQTSYWVRVSNTYGTADSTTATISIGVGAAIGTSPQSQTIASNTTANLSVGPPARICRISGIAAPRRIRRIWWVPTAPTSPRRP